MSAVRTVGERHIAPGEPVLEWCVDSVWTPVCAACDVAMRAHNDDRLLCCGLCGGVFPEAAMRG